MKTFLTKSAILFANPNGMSYFQSNEGCFLRFADPKEVKFLSENCPRIQFEVDPEPLENPQGLLWRYVATLSEEETESKSLVFARKWGAKLQFICVDTDQSVRNDCEVAHLKLYGVEGEHKLFVWTGPGRFTGYVDGDLVAVEEVSRLLGFGVNLNWFGQFSPETKLEAFKNLKKILGRTPGLNEVLSRPMNRRRK